MERIRSPPKPPKKLRSPVDDPKIVDEWRALFKQYVEVGKMRKWKALERIAREYGGKSASNIRRYIEPDVRRRENEAKRNRPRPDRETEEYRLRNATRLYVYRNIYKYIHAAFSEDPEIPLSLDELTLRVRDELVKEGRPRILLRNRSLLKYSQQLLQQVPGYEPPVYLLAERTF